MTRRLLAALLATTAIHQAGASIPGFVPPWAAPSATATAAAADGAAVVAACRGVGAASVTATGSAGEWLSVSCEVISNLQLWLAPLLRDGGPLPGAPTARAAAGSSAAAAAVELPPPCTGARAFTPRASPPTCSGPAVNLLIAGGRCEVGLEDGHVTCVGPSVTATPVPPRCHVQTGGTAIVDAHCGAPGAGPLFQSAEAALAFQPDWGAPVASAAGLAAALGAALAPARAASAASVMESG